jgi:hypothetical protein
MPLSKAFDDALVFAADLHRNQMALRSKPLLVCCRMLQKIKEARQL